MLGFSKCWRDYWCEKQNYCFTSALFFAVGIFSANSKVKSYQNKTREKSLYPSEYVLTTYLKEI